MRPRPRDRLAYLAGYCAALRELRDLLVESTKPPIIVLYDALGDKLQAVERERETFKRDLRRAEKRP